MANFKLSIEELLANKNSIIKLTLPTNKVVTAFMVSDTFDISASANYEAMFQRNAIQDLVASKSRAIGEAMKYGEKLLGVRAETIEQTRLTWSGTERPTFSLELLFVTIKADDDPREKVTMLLEGCFPSEGKTPGMLSAPWSFGLLKGTEGGKMTVKIGNWFQAPNQVLTNASFQLSRETVETGVPLYAQGNIQFKPFEQLLAKQVKSYFLPSG